MIDVNKVSKKRWSAGLVVKGLKSIGKKDQIESGKAIILVN